MDFIELCFGYDGRYRSFVAHFVKPFNKHAFRFAFASFAVIDVSTVIFLVSEQGIQRRVAEFFALPCLIALLG